MPERLQALKRWLEDELDLADFTLNPASSDASFRRYFRVTHDGASYIVMDAPPDRENSEPFITVARLFLDAGLNVPEVIDENLEQGFILLTDLGKQLYLDALDDTSVERLYGDALGALATIQASVNGYGVLPDYDYSLLMAEMALFREWLIGRHLGISPGGEQAVRMDEVFTLLAENALVQPQVCVHRDYHSRNLMVTARGNPGIIDFQDAVIGPVTYDLVSLLRDCYIGWPQERVEEWALGYRDLCLQSGILRTGDCDAATFLRWFDLMGIQRHLKAAGIFARLNHRDGKPGYLGDIPRTLGYVVQVAARHADLAAFGKFIERDVLARL